MPRPRDNQRSRVYAWERSAVSREHWRPCFESADDAARWLAPIWRAERGRVGLANWQMPQIERPHWGQRRALAHDDHRITLPKWARSPWVVLHEAAHRLTPRDEAHGPRFVGVLIGLGCRHLDLDADALMRAADQGGVRYHVRSIGMVPVHGAAWHVAKTIRAHGAMSDMDLAAWLSLAEGVDVSVKQIRGAALALIRAGRARWWRGRLELRECSMGGTA